MKRHLIIFILILISFQVSSTECKRLFTPFTAGLKSSDLVVLGKILHLDDKGHASIEILQRFSGICTDTIKYIDLNGGLGINKIGDKLIMLLNKNIGSETFYSPECIQSSLTIQQDNTVEGNITRLNGFICRFLFFMHIDKYPSNHISFERICKMINRKINAT